MIPTLSYLTAVHFETGARKRLPQVLAGLSASRPLLVTDRGVLANVALEELGLGDAPRHDGVSPDPKEADVEHGLRLYQAARCDSVVALGGGSAMDCAKCIALLVTHPPPLIDYAFIRGGAPRIRREKPPVVAVPTTAGTGSEVGRGALITFPGGSKLALLSPALIPDAAICDPELTLSLPPFLTAGTGMDAISHCVETFLSPRWNPVADAIALDGLERAVRSLPLAHRDGSSLEARTEMLLAALEGGLTFQKGLGAVHALSHPLGGVDRPHAHHGALNAIFLPHVLRFNSPVCQEKYARLARLLGLATAEEVPGFFDRLREEVGLPARLGDLGFERPQLEALAPSAHADHCRLTNPRPAAQEELQALYRAAW